MTNTAVSVADLFCGKVGDLMPDRKNVIKELKDIRDSIKTGQINGTYGMGVTINDAIAMLEEQEAVVRCKDCKHYLPKGILSFCNLHGIFRVGCDCCYDGVKRE